MFGVSVTPMDNQRRDLIEKTLREMFLAFRSIRPEHDHEKEHKDLGHKLGHHFGGWFGAGFGQGKRELIFRLIKEKEGINVKEIAEALKITSGAVTQMVDKAVETGVVTREEDPKDRRSQIIKLSENARDKVAKFRRIFIEKAEVKLADLTNEELSQLTQLLGKINKPTEAIK